jgi:hypothetical protein
MLRKVTTLPFVISTGAQRSGEICGSLHQQPMSRKATTLPFVISTEACQDFLLRAASDGHVCGSPQKEPHADHQSHESPQEIRTSAVERSLCGCSPVEMFFRRAYRVLTAEAYFRRNHRISQHPVNLPQQKLWRPATQERSTTNPHPADV